MNKVVLTGRLCETPELKYIGENNIPVTKFTLAVRRDYKNSDGKYDSDFIDCEVWRKQAEIFCTYLSKGDLIAIDGSLRLEKYLSSTGENKRYIKVHIDSFDFLNTKKRESNSNNIVNADAVFDNESVFNDEISESEIPF